MERPTKAMMERDLASAALGMVVEHDEPGRAVVSMRVRDDMTNGFHITHGGLVFALADTLRRVKESAKFCEVCFNVTQEDRCRVCRDPRRDRSMICVVEESKDVIAIERTSEFRGLYHVLGGSISPIDGRGRSIA